MIPGWPGEDAYPPQPMIAQTRAVLDRYAAVGGTYAEVVYDGCGHTPHVQRPVRLAATLADLADRAR